MISIVDFLNARINEEEAVAHLVINERRRVTWIPRADREGPDTYVGSQVDSAWVSVGIGAERWLVECQAKRAIIAEHPGVQGAVGGAYCRTCDVGDDAPPYEREPLDWPCPTIRHLAAVYADHPDYNPTWKP